MIKNTYKMFNYFYNYFYNFFFILLVVNAEHAAHKSEKFTHMARRTRYEYLKDLANNQVSQQTLETSNKFGKLLFFVAFGVLNQRCMQLFK